MRSLLANALATTGCGLLLEVVLRIHNHKFETAIVLGVGCLAGAVVVVER